MRWSGVDECLVPKIYCTWAQWSMLLSQSKSTLSGCYLEDAQNTIKYEHGFSKRSVKKSVIPKITDKAVAPSTLLREI